MNKKLRTFISICILAWFVLSKTGILHDIATPISTETSVDVGSVISVLPNEDLEYAEPAAWAYDKVDDSVMPQYQNAAVSIVSDKPFFTPTEAKAFEYYAPLDNLGRVTRAAAVIGKETMPTEKRGDIGMVKPTGWHQNKYEGVVNSNPPYLYNRCHLIGYQLTAENATIENLMTGTRYFNVDAMLPYENEIADYIKTTENHVAFRVTPYFQNNDLLARGLLMDAYSIEDNGKGVCFCVFAHNVQPGVWLDYATGENRLE